MTLNQRCGGAQGGGVPGPLLAQVTGSPAPALCDDSSVGHTPAPQEDCPPEETPPGESHSVKQSFTPQSFIHCSHNFVSVEYLLYY